MGLSCRVKVGLDNRISVSNEDGSPSFLFTMLENILGDQQEALDAWAFSNTPTAKKFFGNIEPTAEQVILAMDTVATTGMRLNLTEMAEISQVMADSGLITLGELASKLNRAFQPNGVFEVDVDEAVRTGLYAPSDIDMINYPQLKEVLDKINGTLAVYDFGTEVNTGAKIYDTQNKTILGTPTVIFVAETEADLIDKVKNTNDVDEVYNVSTQQTNPEFADKVQNSTEYFQDIVQKISKVTKVPVVKMDGDSISSDDSSFLEEFKNTLIERDNVPRLNGLIKIYQELISPSDWDNMSQEDKREQLQDIERELVEEVQVDFIGLRDKSIRYNDVLGILYAVRDAITNPNKESIERLSSLRQEYFGAAEVEQVPEILDETYKGLTIVKSYSSLSPKQMFEKNGLIKIGEDLYHKIQLETFDKDAMYEAIYRSVLNGDSVVPLDIFKGIDYKDQSKKVEVLQRLNVFINSRNTGIPTKMNEILSLVQVYSKHKPVPAVNQSKNLRALLDIKSDPAYLTTTFVTDFYKDILREKFRGSYLYENVLKYFKITNKDITMTRANVNVEMYPDYENLVDYARLKTDGIIKSIVPPTAEHIVTEELQMVNYPDKVQEPLSYSTVAGEYLITNSNETFLKKDDVLYRRDYQGEGLSVYRKVRDFNDTTYLTNNINFKSDINKAEEVYKKFRGAQSAGILYSQIIAIEKNVRGTREILTSPSLIRTAGELKKDLVFGRDYQGDLGYFNKGVDESRVKKLAKEFKLGYRQSSAGTFYFTKNGKLVNILKMDEGKVLVNNTPKDKLSKSQIELVNLYNELEANQILEDKDACSR